MHAHKNIFRGVILSCLQSVSGTKNWFCMKNQKKESDSRVLFQIQDDLSFFCPLHATLRSLSCSHLQVGLSKTWGVVGNFWRWIRKNWVSCAEKTFLSFFLSLSLCFARNKVSSQTPQKWKQRCARLPGFLYLTHHERTVRMSAILNNVRGIRMYRLRCWAKEHGVQRVLYTTASTHHLPAPAFTTTCRWNVDFCSNFCLSRCFSQQKLNINEFIYAGFKVRLFSRAKFSVSFVHWVFDLFDMSTQTRLWNLSVWERLLSKETNWFG